MGVNSFSEVNRGLKQKLDRLFPNYDCFIDYERNLRNGRWSVAISLNLDDDDLKEFLNA